ncbi:MAG TPA: hypothetical protein VEQ40_09245 [Pyrinomonadaceae bacterium]|nr:hypothetical protein [Pyrinomonadaceae bacterium]
MARRKRNSSILEKADARLSGLRTISATLDLGPGLTLAELEAKIAEFRTKQTNYNNMLPALDALSNELDADEKAMEELLSRFLAAVGARWGKNHTNYELAGGTRTDERKRGGGRNKPPTDGE